ncbi:hypothetical protein MTO96_033053 [Rhipicephalus appendiculatus]
MFPKNDVCVDNTAVKKGNVLGCNNRRLRRRPLCDSPRARCIEIPALIVPVIFMPSLCQLSLKWAVKNVLNTNHLLMRKRTKAKLVPSCDSCEKNDSLDAAVPD